MATIVILNAGLTKLFIVSKYFPKSFFLVANTKFELDMCNCATIGDLNESTSVQIHRNLLKTLF